MKPESEKIDFPNYAVCMAYDLSDIEIAPAYIDPQPYTYKDKGFIDGTSTWGEITKSKVKVTFDVHNLSTETRNTMESWLGGVWFGLPGIYRTHLEEGDIGKFLKLELRTHIIGIFKTKEDALNAIAERHKEEVNNILRKIDAIPGMEEISKRFDNN